MNSEYVTISHDITRKKWRWYEFAGWLCACALVIVGIHAALDDGLQTRKEWQVGAGSDLNPNEIDLPEEEVGVKLIPVTDLSTGQPRLFVVKFECQPEQVEFVQHLITNVALLANENRDIPDAKGQAETFISYEAFASTRPVTRCDQLFLLEAYPNEASQRIHGRAAYKNGLEIMQVLRGTKAENGLPGFNFARKGLMTTFACESDCREEVRQEKLNLIHAERKKQEEVENKKDNKEADTDTRIYTGGIGGHGVTRYKKTKPKDPEKMMRERERKAYLKKRKGVEEKAKEEKAKESKEEKEHANPEDYYSDEEVDLQPLTHHIISSDKTRGHYVRRVFRPRGYKTHEAYEQMEEDMQPRQEVSPMSEYFHPMVADDRQERQIVPVRTDRDIEDYEDQEPQKVIVIQAHPKPDGVHVMKHQIHHTYEDANQAHENHHIIYTVDDGDSRESHAEHASHHIIYALDGDEQPRHIARPIYGEASGD